MTEHEIVMRLRFLREDLNKETRKLGHLLIQDFEQLIPEIIQALERTQSLFEQFEKDDQERMDRINHLSVSLALKDQEIAALRNEIERGHSVLAAAGIPRTRAKNLPTGIIVLETRLTKELEDLQRQLREASK